MVGHTEQARGGGDMVSGVGPVQEHGGAQTSTPQFTLRAVSSEEVALRGSRRREWCYIEPVSD